MATDLILLVLHRDAVSGTYVPGTQGDEETRCVLGGLCLSPNGTAVLKEISLCPNI